MYSLAGKAKPPKKSRSPSVCVFIIYWVSIAWPAVPAAMPPLLYFFQGRRAEMEELEARLEGHLHRCCEIVQYCSARAARGSKGGRTHSAL